MTTRKFMHVTLFTAVAGLALGITATTAPAAFTGWKGGVATDGDLWSAADNWTAFAAKVPDFNDIARFESRMVVNTIDVQQNIFAGEIFQNGGGSVTIGLAGNPSNATLTIGNSLGVRWQTGSNLTFNVDVAVDDADQLWEFNAAAPDLTLNGTLDLGNNTLTVRQDTNSSMDMQFNDVISGSGNLALRTNGTVLNADARLFADNTYTGTTTVGDGVSLRLQGGSLANSNITIGDGADSDNPGILLGVDGDEGTLNYNIVNNNADLIQLAASNAQLRIDDLNIDFNVTGPLTQSKYIIADYGTGTLVGTEFNSVIDLPADSKIDYAFNNGTQIALIVPEPASLAMGLVGFGALALRRRRRN
mgnify:CR=1 FL=1